MTTATAMKRQELNAAEAFLAIETRGISLTPILRGRFWLASADIYGAGHNSRRAVRSMSATCVTSLGAVSKLVRLLEGEGLPMPPMPPAVLDDSFPSRPRKIPDLTPEMASGSKR